MASSGQAGTSRTASCAVGSPSGAVPPGGALVPYGRAARQDAVLARLRSEPAYAADCFTVWSAHPHAGETWSTTRTALLEEVLRPAVRALSPEQLTAVEEAASHTGSSRTAEAFRSWHRSGGGLRRRLGSRIAARVRRA
ncbi:GTPase-associated protein 1-related protein [Streptomyces sp. NPDC057499]|uniref:GTPase-associated protein 1-related protein n=1 Tax=Streptomyces sp. NPDC057499 TaxID=3346150 RepID=UPI0036A02EE6